MARSVVLAPAGEPGLVLDLVRIFPWIFRMTSELTAVLTFAAALGSAVIGGVFFAFSSFVMTALASRPLPSVIAWQNFNFMDPLHGLHETIAFSAGAHLRRV